MNGVSDFIRRFFISIVVISFVTIITYFSHFSKVKLFVGFIVAMLAFMAVWEFVQLVKIKKITLSLTWMLCSTLLQVAAFYFITEFQQWKQLPILLFTLMLIPLFFQQFSHINQAIQKLALSIFSIILFVIPLSMLLPILYLPSSAGDGRLWLAYLLVVVKIGDIGGYIGGKLFGKRKLAKEISPKKTYAGAVVGLLLSILASLSFYWLRFYFNEGQIELTFVDALILGAIFGIVGQFSDLAISLLKRDAGVKDSNKIPGIGGIIDMVDSLLLTTPLLFFFLF